MERGVWEGSVCGHDCAYKTSGASRVDGVPWNWPGRLQQRGSRWIAKQQCASAGRRLRACRAMPASQASSRSTPACLPACGRSVLHRPRVGDPPAPSPARGGLVRGGPRRGRSTSVVVVSLDEAVQCSARACSEVTSCQPSSPTRHHSHSRPQQTSREPHSITLDHSAKRRVQRRRASARWRMALDGW